MFKKHFILFLVFSILTISLYSQEEEESTDYVKFGGALRYNIFDKSWVKSATEPEFTWDVWRLNVDASYSEVDISFEYRFYPTSANSHFIHHGWIGYGFGEKDDLYMKLGVSQVPFGITKYASHSWWFQIPYYVGLEDDYDMGVKFDYTGVENLKLSLAYFRQPEPRGVPNEAARYSYDVTGVYTANADYDTTASIMELNQANVRVAYNVNEGIEIGASAQMGGLYNSAINEIEMTSAFAGHVVANFGNLNFKGEYIYYDFTGKDDANNDLDIIQMGAYGYNYNVASKANMYVAGIAYSIPVKFGPISNIQPYVDWSMIDKAEGNFEDTQHLIPGFLITAGNVYTYVDYAWGINNAWLGEWTNGLAAGNPNADWESRFNINIGYYF